MKAINHIIFALVALLIFNCGAALAQITGGTVSGTIRNSLGQPISGASVRATNLGTNQTRSTETDAEGSFRILSLAVGTYEVTVKATAYAEVARQLVLRVNDDARVDFELTAEGTSETVTVADSSTPLTETSNSVLGIVIENKQINELPLNGRNFLQLGTLVPNVSSTASLRSGAEGGILNGPFAVSGQRDRSLTFLVDGVDNNNSLSNSLSAQVSLDAIQEFKMITSLGSAEFGHHSGGMMNIVTKSGTNDFRLSAFEFLRNNKLNAPNHFEKLAGREASKFINNQFGGTLSGPLVKDRTFFFSNYEAQRLRVGTPQFSNVPTAEERRGIFRHPLTGRMVQLPVDPLSTRLLNQFVPLPNTQSEFGNYLSTPTIKTRNDFGLVKVDHLLTGDDVLNARYFVSDNATFNPIIFNSIRFASALYPTIPGFGLNDRARTHNLATSWTHNFSTQTINDLRFGYSRHFNNLAPEDQTKPSDLGFVGAPNAKSLFSITAPGMSQIGNMGFPFKLKTNNFHVSDSLALLRGSHDIKIGGEMRVLRQRVLAIGEDQGAINFTGQASGISAIADFLMGIPYSAILFNHGLESPLNQESYGIYGQDNYQVNSRLTLNFGLRYELNTVISADGQLTNFSLKRGYFTPGRDTDTGLYNGDHNNFAPRVGFAWNVTGSGKTVVRGGYGIYYDNMVHTTAVSMHSQNKTEPWISTSLAPRRPGGLAGIYAANSLFYVPAELNVYDENLRTPYAQHFNLTLQREIGNNAMLSFGYVGTKGTKLVRVRDINQAIYLPGNDANANPLTVPGPFNSGMRRPTQLFRLTKEPIGLITNTETSASSIYHAFHATLTKRLSNGLSVLSSYTWSKSIDDAADPVGFTGDNGGPQNSYDLRQERARSIFDMRHRFTTGFVYNFPFYGNRFKEGWQINGIATLQSGQPFTIGLGFDPSLTSSNSPRPNNVPGAFIVKGGQVTLNPNLPIDRATGLPVGLIPQPGQFGTLGRNTFTGPDYKNIDLSVIKSTRLTERLQMQTRFEAFNVFNTTNLALPNRTLGEPFFGRSTKTQDVAGGVPGVGGGGPRVFQLALKFIY